MIIIIIQTVQGSNAFKRAGTVISDLALWGDLGLRNQTCRLCQEKSLLLANFMAVYVTNASGEHPRVTWLHLERVSDLSEVIVFHRRPRPIKVLIGHIGKIMDAGWGSAAAAAAQPVIQSIHSSSIIITCLPVRLPPTVNAHDGKNGS